MPSRITAERHLPWFALATLFATAGFLGARCYAALPGRTATVAAVSSLTAPFQLAVPIAAGLIAEAWGPGATVAALGIGGAIGVIALVPEPVRRRVPP